MSSDRQQWYTLTAGPDQAGVRQTRYYVIECRCGRQASQHASGLTNDRLRKFFIRNGWHIGKTTTQHRCPGCNSKHADKPAVVTKPPPSVMVTPPPSRLHALQMAWDMASPGERKAFLATVYPSAIATNGSAMPEPVTAPEPEPVEAEELIVGEVADWWVEMEKKAVTT